MNESAPPTETIDNQGGRRLATLGIGAIFIALLTSGISLYIYTSSGDIYLDRSRPGFISDQEPPVSNPDGPTTIFSPDGPVTKTTLTEYLKKLDALIKDISSESDAFSATALSDEALNISGSADY